MPSYTATQIFQWLYQKKVFDPDLFSNVKAAYRDLLKCKFVCTFPNITSHKRSQDGSEKVLLENGCEMVIMPYEKRTTLCLSSQVGCRMGCTFCQTGKMGLMKNLKTHEIVEELLLAEKLIDKRITNVVFMGMGEPLDNYHAVKKAVHIFYDKKGLAIKPSKITISTCGIIPQIEMMAKELPVRLAISLHSADTETRTKLMPISRKYPLADLKKMLLKYPKDRYGITFEYLLIEGVNDSVQDAKKLVQYVHGLKARVNLIPLLPSKNFSYNAPSEPKIRAFANYLREHGIVAPVRYSRGADISGGCGQLSLDT